MKNTFVVYYDKNGRELLGSDNCYYVDGRKSISTLKHDITAQIKAQNHAHKKNKHYVPCFAENVKIFCGHRFEDKNLLGEFNLLL